MMAYNQRKIEIPFGEGDEVLDLPLDRLPEFKETIGILKDQKCKINLWIQVATEYYRQGKDEAFEQILVECLEEWTQDRIRLNHDSYPDADKERIKALDLLAIFYVRKGYADKIQRRNYFAKAAQRFTEVDKSDFINFSKHGSEYQFHLLGRAYCCLIEGRNDQADAQFNFVLQQQQQSGEPENIPSLLGRACIEFNKKEGEKSKRTALGLYKRALQVCPDCPADVRLGLGLCFYKLNMIEKAEAAFTKALSMDPTCVGALAGLAVIELNKKTGPSIKRGMEYLSKAFKIKSTDAMVLTLLADHFFYANEHEKVKKLATRAIDNTENDATKAQAEYQLGRAHHKQNDYEKAYTHYYKATVYGGPQFFLAYYGLGQMYIHRGEHELAIEAFENVLKTNPDNNETLKVLASLYARSDDQEKRDQAKIYLEKVTKNRPDDVEAWVELASLTEQYDTPTALNAYRTSIKLYESRSKPVLPELYNNIAALLFSINDLDEAERYYNLALERCKEEMPNNELHYGSIVYTIRYNMGRLYEANHQLTEAEKTYKNILIQHPMYLDCYLRLGCIERDKGYLFDASDKFKEIFRIDSENFEAWTLIANLHLSKLELTPCQKKFERILDRTKNNPDCYSLVQVGNVWLLSQFQPTKDVDKQRGRALLFYKNALRYDKKNIYAANGIGCIFAVKHMYPEARDIFSQVREATADFPDVWINIAHIYVEQNQYVAAVQMYENCLKKFYNNANTEILLYIARALYKAGKYAECKKAILRARYINPHDLAILFNLAKVLKTLARHIFEDRKSTYQAVVTAEYELKLAKGYFRYYGECRDKRESDRNTIHSNIVYLEEKECTDLLLQVERSIKTDAEQRDREELERRREHEEELARELAKKAEEELKKQEIERVKKEEIENKRRELLKKQEEAKQKMLQEDNSFVNDDASGDEDPNNKGKRKKKSKEGGKKKDKTEKQDRPRDSQEKDRVDNSNKKYKSRAILSSDSDSSDDED